MHQNTLDLLERYYAAFNAQNMDDFAGLLADDVVHDINQGQRQHGKETFMQFMERMNTSYRERISDIEIMTNADGSRAAAEYTVDGTYLSSDEGLPPAHGQTYRLRGGAFFEIRHGKIARVTNYYNLEDWLNQVRS